MHIPPNGVGEFESLNLLLPCCEWSKRSRKEDSIPRSERPWKSCKRVASAKFYYFGSVGWIDLMVASVTMS